MATAPTSPTDAASIQAEERIGFAKLTKLAFDGVSLLPMFNDLTQKVDAGVATAGDGMDLSLITQLLGERDTGMAIENEVLRFTGCTARPARPRRRGSRCWRWRRRSTWAATPRSISCCRIATSN